MRKPAGISGIPRSGFRIPQQVPLGQKVPQ